MLVAHSIWGGVKLLGISQHAGTAIPERTLTALRRLTYFWKAARRMYS